MISLSGRWLCCFLLYTLSTVTVAQTVQDLRYGVTLYHFFQRDYFNALTELTVAQALATDPQSPLRKYHEQQASLLKGGMSLSYGLDRAAEQSFLQWLADVPAEASSAWHRQHQRAWFYLGKLNYQRGETARALASLQQSNGQSTVQPDADSTVGALNEGLLQESLYLQSKMYMQVSDFEQAKMLINALPEDSLYLPYYWFNRGSQLAAVGDWSAAIRSYLELRDLPLHSDVDKALRDRALTAAGFALLQSDRIGEAIAAFSAVRLASPTSDRALLGLGWAHLQQGQPSLSLAPWQQLRSQSLLLSSVQEVYLALPYAYEQLQADAPALREYEFASQALATEINRLRDALHSYRETPLEQLFGLDVTSNSDWLMAEEIQPLGDRAPYLSHLFARHDFQAAIKDYRDLINLRRHLQVANERLQVLQFVDGEQQILWQRTIEGGAFEQYLQRHVALQQSVDELDQKITAASEDETGRLLADERRLDLWRIVDRSQQNLKRLNASGEASNFEADQLRRFRGLLLWEDSEQYMTALWELKSQRKALAELLEESEQRLQSLRETIANRQQSQQAPRIDALMARTQQQRELVRQQLLAQEQTIRQLATTELQQQQDRLQGYLGKAKLSIARLYDKYSEDTER